MDSESVRIAGTDTDVPLSDLVGRVAADVYCTDLHVSVCAQLAGQLAVSPADRLIVENLLFLKSVRARAVTALIWLLRNLPGEIQSMRLCSDALDAIRSVGVVSVPRFEDIGANRRPFVDTRHVHRLVLKAVLHRIFRLFRRPLPAGKSLLRAWVDVSLPMYEAELPTLQLRIHPFPLRVSRQLRFIMECRRRGLDCSLDGLPYSITRSLCLLLPGAARDLRIAKIEKDAYEAHADEILAASPPSFLTSDEYEVGAIALYERLIRAGVHVVNTAHGVGMYSPHVAYSEFRITNAEQGEFYARRNPAIRFVVRQTYNRKLPLSVDGCLKSDRVALVLVHQDFESYSWWAEAHAQRRIGAALKEIATSLGIDYFVKLHPNTRPRHAEQLAIALGGKPLARWEGLDGFRPIFVLINSTAYFEVREVGATLVYAGPSFMPELYFGTGFRSFTELTLREQVRMLIDRQDWLAAVHAPAIPVGSAIDGEVTT